MHLTCHACDKDVPHGVSGVMLKPWAVGNPILETRRYVCGAVLCRGLCWRWGQCGVRGARHSLRARHGQAGGDAHGRPHAWQRRVWRALLPVRTCMHVPRSKVIVFAQVAEPCMWHWTSLGALARTLHESQHVLRDMYSISVVVLGTRIDRDFSELLGMYS